MPLDFNDKSDSAQWIRQQSPTYLSVLQGFTTAGVMADLSTPRSKDLIGTLSNVSAINWSRTYGSARDALAKELSLSLKSADAPRSAQLEIAAQELQFLNESPTNVRYALIQGLRHNDETYEQLRPHALAVYKSCAPDRINVFVAEDQDKVVKDVDSIDPKALQLELRSIDKVLAGETDAKITLQLESKKVDLLSAMAAPFVERCRNGAIQEFLTQGGFEERDMKDAMQKLASVPAEAWKLESNRKFRDDMTSEYNKVHVLNNLQEMFDANLPKLDLIDHNGAVNKAELKMAADKHDPALAPLISVLSDSYETLTESHWQPFSKDGITSADVKSFVDKRQQMNRNPMR